MLFFHLMKHVAYFTVFSKLNCCCGLLYIYSQDQQATLQQLNFTGLISKLEHSVRECHNQTGIKKK